MTGFLGAIVSQKSKSRYFLDIRDIFSETIEVQLFPDDVKLVTPRRHLFFMLRQDSFLERRNPRTEVQ